MEAWSHGASLKSLCGYATANQHSAVSHGNVVRGLIEGEFIKNKHSVPFGSLPIPTFSPCRHVSGNDGGKCRRLQTVGGPSRAVVFGIAL